MCNTRIDSVNGQVWSAFQNMLALPHPRILPHPFTDVWGFGPSPTLEGVQQRAHYNNVTLAKGHALRERLESLPELAHIPRSRFDEPVARFWRSDLLIAQEELEPLWDGLESDWKGRPEGVKLVFNGKFRTLTPWREELVIYSKKGPEWDGELPALLLIASGPHWDPGRLLWLLLCHGCTKLDVHSQICTCRGGQSARSVREDGQLHFLTNYAAFDIGPQTKMISDSLLSIKNLPMRVLFRSNTPGHEHCSTFNHPISIDDPVAKDPTGTREGTYGWHLFPSYDSIARSYFANRQNGDVWLDFMNVWDMSVVRPDAHIAWTGMSTDCLHVSLLSRYSPILVAHLF